MIRNNRTAAADIGNRSPTVVLPGTPEWVTPELIDHTIRVWQPHYETPLTPDEAVTMILSVGRLFGVISRGPEP
jgi:hypothetical protein